MAAQEIIAENPETGERITLVNGKWVPAGDAPASAGSAQDRSALAAALSAAGAARRTADTAGQFVARNRTTGTGGIETIFADKGPIGATARTAAGWLFPKTMENVTTMDALSARMLRDNIQPGTSSTMNSEGEMRAAMATFPSVNAPGPTNVNLARELALAARLAEAKSTAMDAFVKENGSLNGFDQEWARQEQRLRAQGPGRWAPPAPRAPAPAARRPAATGEVINLGAIR
jgi:hypothetical protein